jgi:hypothetical protein
MNRLGWGSASHYGQRSRVVVPILSTRSRPFPGDSSEGPGFLRCSSAAGRAE